jgi:hypothetical protein
MALSAKVQLRKLRLSLRTGCTCAPGCLEEVFSETHIRDREYNCVGSTKLSALSSPAAQTSTQYMGAVNKQPPPRTLRRVRSTTSCVALGGENLLKAPQGPFKA